MMVREGQLTAVALVLCVIIRIGEFVQVAANCGLGFLLLGPDNRLKSLFGFADIGVTPKEIHCSSSKPKQLGHDRVVVVIFRNVAIGAILRRAHAAGGMWKMRIERLAAVALRRDGLLLRVSPLAIL